MKFASNNSIDLDLKVSLYCKPSQIRVLKYLSCCESKLRIMQSNEDLERFYFPYLWVYHRKYRLGCIQWLKSIEFDNIFLWDMQFWCLIKRICSKLKVLTFVGLQKGKIIYIYFPSRQISVTYTTIGSKWNQYTRLKTFLWKKIIILIGNPARHKP